MENAVPERVIEDRLKRILDLASREGLEYVLLAQPENVQYATGFDVVGNPPKTAYALVAESLEGPILMVPPLEYKEAVDTVSPLVKVVSFKLGEKPLKALLRLLVEYQVRGCVGLDLCTREMADGLRAKLEVREVKDLNDGLLKLREVKDSYEVECIRQATRVVEAGLQRAYEVLREGVREVDVAAEVERALRIEGAEGMAFDTIVASGPRSAYPHAKPTKRVIKRGEVVVVDLGVRVHGYCSDMTRTFIVGENREASQVIAAVKGAQEAALKVMRDGVKASTPDAEARRALKEKALDEYFIHSLGHGVGLSVHEGPALSSSSNDVLREGNVVTVEPGVYIPGKFGVRLEDVVLINKGGWSRISRLEGL